MADIPPPAKAAILTLGCKLNIADSEAMARRLREAGWIVTGRANGNEDAVIVNTCSVTHTADHKSRHLTRMARRIAPRATVAITGCLMETAAPDRIDALKPDMAYRQPDQLALAEKLIQLHGGGLLPVISPDTDDSAQTEPESDPAAALPSFKTRGFISAQEGCNDVCAFCIIPRTRGRERSRSIAHVVEEAQKREAEGVQEIVITGTQLGHYGSDIGVELKDLLAALLQETAIPRIRISSVQPQDLSDSLIALWPQAGRRLCRHLHLSLQSGSRGVLERMRRRYTQDEYRNTVRQLKTAIPGVAITTDVIAGFPGETDAEFDECYDFCREMAFAGIHVFPYSQRHGTLGVRLPNQIADDVKKQRVRRLIELANTMSDEFRAGLIGQTEPVLWETRRDNQLWEGLTDTYVRVRAPSDSDLKNRLLPTRITAAGKEVLLGEVKV